MSERSPLKAPRLASARLRVATAAAAGAAAGVALASFVPWEVATLGGWDVAAVVFVTWVLVTVVRATGEETRAMAGPTDLSRRVADPILVGASLGCLVGVGFTLLKASHASGAGKAALVAIAVFSVVASWLVVQTMFTLRYADLYYSKEPGGIAFNEADGFLPRFVDFAYVAFTVGMTYQVSDTNVTKSAIRRETLKHALLSFVFGTFILATTINVLASLLQG
ncbi:MAG: hypothetical protein QOI47_989 [Actinomycetota bacterium]|nr:hypothetical protein [Actinomycetota bacterium]